MGCKDKSSLRDIAKIVAETVRIKQKTTYNEVADELVKDTLDKGSSSQNTRRRVYDALNVLRSLKVIEVNNKEISWNGFDDMYQVERSVTGRTSSSSSSQQLNEMKQRISSKQERLRSLCNREVLLRCLLQRRRSTNDNAYATTKSTIIAPFYVVSISKCEQLSSQNGASSLLLTSSSPLEVYSSSTIVDRIDPLNICDQQFVDYAHYSLPASCIIPH
ncbi:hypothetical protein P9112_004074 [Eukaryota sp. TZLM1-RC]